MALSFLMEIILVSQTIAYGRAEHAPGFSQRAWAAAVLLGLGGTLVIWLVVKGTFADPYYLMSLGLVTAAYPPMGTALLLHRQSRQGQTPLMWAAFTGLALLWYPATTIGFGDAFRSWPWIGIGLVTIVWGAVNTWLVAKVPARRPEPAAGPAPEPAVGTRT